ncbi:translation initiation factor IF-2-like [Onychostruthus taczanowskii]|uniref:translation initiation factor IF-2-like n=1 Tax=Onychostruthus taczanowskii TaxID=356909 RepID=UPI001B809B2E|nr:translation initiation factor IF-2-like [Onychostruthus taczanowskii]
MTAQKNLQERQSKRGAHTAHSFNRTQPMAILSHAARSCWGNTSVVIRKNCSEREQASAGSPGRTGGREGRQEGGWQRGGKEKRAHVQREAQSARVLSGQRFTGAAAPAIKQRREDAAASCGPPRKAVAPFSRKLCLSKFARSVPQHIIQRDIDVPSGTHGSPGQRRSPARTPCVLPRRGTSRPRDKPAPAGAPPAARPPLGEGRAGPRGRELAPSPLQARSRRRPSPPRTLRAARRTPAAAPPRSLPSSPAFAALGKGGGRAPGARSLHPRPPAQRCPAGGAGGAEGAAGTEGTKAAAAGNKERQICLKKFCKIWSPDFL